MCDKKSCPFCGKNVLYILYEERLGKVIWCQSCGGAITGHCDVEELTRRWNTRKQYEQIEQIGVAV